MQHSINKWRLKTTMQINLKKKTWNTKYQNDQDQKKRKRDEKKSKEEVRNK